MRVREGTEKRMFSERAPQNQSEMGESRKICQMKLFYMALINDGSCNLCSAHELIHSFRSVSFHLVWNGFGASSGEKMVSKKWIPYIIVQCQNCLAHTIRVFANQKYRKTIERSH